MEHNTFTTQDMTLVTVLKIHGIEPESMGEVGGGCQWVYRATNTLDDIVSEYVNEQEFVEPRDFAKKMAMVRGEMYRFLGVQKREVRKPA